MYLLEDRAKLVKKHFYLTCNHRQLGFVKLIVKFDFEILLQSSSIFKNALVTRTYSQKVKCIHQPIHLNLPMLEQRNKQVVLQ